VKMSTRSGMACFPCRGLGYIDRQNPLARTPGRQAGGEREHAFLGHKYPHTTQAGQSVMADLVEELQTLLNAKVLYGRAQPDVFRLHHGEIEQGEPVPQASRGIKMAHPGHAPGTPQGQPAKSHDTERIEPTMTR